MTAVSRTRGSKISPARGAARLRKRATPELIVIGCSLGGMYALESVLCALPAGFETPIAIAQHRHKTSSDNLPDFYRRSCKLHVMDAEDKQWIKPRTVYFAPADYHLLVEKGILNLSIDDLVSYSRPSIDVLFESAADAYGSHLIGVVLTGANDDGAEGAKRIKRRGGLVIAQDPRTAEAPKMPRAVIATGAVDQILRLEEIAPFLVERCRLAIHA
jgi:two-component system, chemotaxis family, protein-glutamate methylesterase/glutaminase